MAMHRHRTTPRPDAPANSAINRNAKTGRYVVKLSDGRTVEVSTRVKARILEETEKILRPRS